MESNFNRQTDSHNDYSARLRAVQHSDANSLFVCFVALRPKSRAMVMAGRSVHLTTLFPGQA